MDDILSWLIKCSDLNRNAHLETCVWKLDQRTWHYYEVWHCWSRWVFIGQSILLKSGVCDFRSPNQALWLKDFLLPADLDVKFSVSPPASCLPVFNNDFKQKNKEATMWTISHPLLNNSPKDGRVILSLSSNKTKTALAS